jgi:hypothetical protein
LAENLEGMVWVVEDATLINDEGTPPPVPIERVRA